MRQAPSWWKGPMSLSVKIVWASDYIAGQHELNGEQLGKGTGTWRELRALVHTRANLRQPKTDAGYWTDWQTYSFPDSRPLLIQHIWHEKEKTYSHISPFALSSHFPLFELIVVTPLSKNLTARRVFALHSPHRRCGVALDLLRRPRGKQSGSAPRSVL